MSEKIKSKQISKVKIMMANAKITKTFFGGKTWYT